MKEVLATPLARSEIAALTQALQQEGLPADDISEPGRRFWHFKNSAGATIGFGGLEICGASALLRSVVVVPELQGQGFGQKIVGKLLRCAQDMGITKLYLLTTKAQAFFEAQGFMPVDRRYVPAEIMATRQAAQFCPGSAVILFKEVSDFLR